MIIDDMKKAPKEVFTNRDYVNKIATMQDDCSICCKAIEHYIETHLNGRYLDYELRGILIEEWFNSPLDRIIIEDRMGRASKENHARLERERVRMMYDNYMADYNADKNRKSRVKKKTVKKRV